MRRFPTMPRNYRLKYWNYKGRGIYMITMNIEGRVPLFGVLQGGADDARVEYSPLGKLVSEQIELAFKPYPQIQICAKQLMPDHLHFVVWIKEEIPKPLGEIIRKLKIGCTQAYRDSGRIDATCINATSLFVTGFHDRVLLHAGQLRSMIDYVHDNPRRAAIKRAYPDLFKLRQAVDVAGFECTALGNRFLLDDPMKEILQCSRSFTQNEINRKKSDCLKLAERGVVFVSADISEGEKQICRALREAGYPLIILLSEGFPAADSPHAKFYKPQGIYFETCAQGKLLLIEPAPALYEDGDIEAEVYAKSGTLPHTTLRYKFLALNALIRRFCNIH